MEKVIRRAVRCYCIRDNKVVAIRYKKGHNKEGYYDMPGGKIEEGELPEEAAIREIKEETGIDANNPIHKGKLIVDAPMRQYELEVFVVYEINGEPEEAEENTSEWLEINELLRKDKKFSNIMLLDAQLIENLINEEKRINLLIEIDDDENILSIKKRG